MKLTSFAKYTWSVLAYNLLVILWGVYVRTSGSGAGCGSHWPLCNGQVIPLAPRIETLVEFTHRLSSGLSLVLIAGLVMWAIRLYPKSHPARKAALASGIFIITEALIGAGLVLFKLVAHDESLARAFSISLHLVNTFLLLASLALTAWWSSGGAPAHIKGQGGLLALLGLGALAVLIIGVSGALTALGDTLFPVNSVAEGLRQDFSPTAHFLIRLRLLHPSLAVASSAYLLVLVGLLNSRTANPVSLQLGRLLSALIAIQVIAGFVNVFLLAPTWMQLVHLLLADSLWITFILFTVTRLSGEKQPETVPLVASNQFR
jgi:heme A synthase